MSFWRLYWVTWSFFALFCFQQAIVEQRELHAMLQPITAMLPHRQALNTPPPPAAPFPNSYLKGFIN